MLKRLDWELNRLCHHSGALSHTWHTLLPTFYLLFFRISNEGMATLGSYRGGSV